MDVLTARVTEAEERVSDLEDRLMEKKKIEEKREKQLTIHKERLQEINDALNKPMSELLVCLRGKRERAQRYI